MNSLELVSLMLLFIIIHIGILPITSFIMVNNC
jgi:hypothetical protein